MAADDSILADIGSLLSDWDTCTTIIATLIVIVLGYVIFLTKDADAHPYILARQASEAAVRQKGESSSMRAHDVPHGYPLKTGLGVRDPDTPKWTFGRRGDLRDIWKAVVRGGLNADGTPSGKRGALYTVLGKDVVEHKIDDITQEINVIGQYIRDTKAQKVAVCLADSVELLATIFAGAFYGFETVIIPHSVTSESLPAYLQQTKADLLIAEAGSVDVSTLLKARTAVKNGIWVAKQGSRHMDWNEVPEGSGSRIEVAVWHELVQEKEGSSDSELPPSDPKSPTPSVSALWYSPTKPGLFVEYTPENLVSGIAALGASLPRGERLTSSDTVLSIDSLSHSYTLCLTLAALYVNASIAFNSVAGEAVDLSLAISGISPTVVIASSHTVSDYHAKKMGPQMNPLAKLGRFFQTRDLDAGTMPSPNFLTRLTASSADTGHLDKLRLICIPHRAGGDSQNQLTSNQLTDLRIYTGARIAYALTAPNVAGAVCQTNPYDYRRHSGNSHFGPPLSSVEVKLTGYDEKLGEDNAREGEINVAGPAVVSGKCNIGVRGKFREDNTLMLSA